MFDPGAVREFYNQYGSREWERLEETPEGRITHHLHRLFLEPCVAEGQPVLDAGCGPGRFSIQLAEAGCRVTGLDLSEGQLTLARARLAERGLDRWVAALVQGDVRDLSRFPDASFQTVVCYGAVLNYLFQDAIAALRELVRVCRPGGWVVVSVNSRWGALRYFIAAEGQDPDRFLGRPDYWHIGMVADTGSLPAHPEVAHPPRRFFTAEELRDLLALAGLHHVELAAAPTLTTGLRGRLREIAASPEAWTTVLSLEERACRQPGLLDSGYHLLARGRV